MAPAPFLMCEERRVRSHYQENLCGGAEEDHHYRWRPEAEKPEQGNTGGEDIEYAGDAKMGDDAPFEGRVGRLDLDAPPQEAIGLLHVSTPRRHETILDAQAQAQRLIDFLIAKTKLYDRARHLLNERQARAIARMFREGPDGFTGGLSAANYISITGAPRAAATRDLADLVAKGVLVSSGTLKSTRYALNLEKA